MKYFRLYILNEIAKDSKPLLKKFHNLNRIELANLLLKETKNIEVGLVEKMVVIIKKEANKK